MKVIGATAPAIAEMEKTMLCCCTCGMTCASITGGIICLFMSLAAFQMAYIITSWLFAFVCGCFGCVCLYMMILNFIVLCINVSNSELCYAVATGNMVCAYSMYVFDGIITLRLMYEVYNVLTKERPPYNEDTDWKIRVFIIVLLNAIFVPIGLCIFSRLGELQFTVAENLQKKEKNHQKKNTEMKTI
jgi:hypothetical protein